STRSARPLQSRSNRSRGSTRALARLCSTDRRLPPANLGAYLYSLECKPQEGSGPTRFFRRVCLPAGVDEIPPASPGSLYRPDPLVALQHAYSSWRVAASRGIGVPRTGLGALLVRSG